MKSLLIIGCGGHGNSVLDCALSLGKYDKIIFMSKDSELEKNRSYDVIKEENISLEYIHLHFDEIIVALGDNQKRLSKTDYYITQGLKMATLVHPSAVVSESAQIGEGSVVLANSVINAYAVIGKACIINSGAVVEHDCILSDGVHVSPKAAIGGSVKIGKYSWLGMGSNVIDRLRIGKNVVVGAGSTVLRGVPDNVMVAGTPALIKKNLAYRRSNHVGSNTSSRGVKGCSE